MELLGTKLAATTTSAFPVSNSLLGIPAEIRNRICELALTTPTGKLTLHANKGPNSGGTYQDFNQIKFTCHQLYSEVRGVELKQNIIVFARDTLDRPGPAVQLVKFLEFLPHHMASWIHTVELVSCDVQHPYVEENVLSFFGEKPIAPDSFTHLVSLAQACKKHPNITVRYILPSFLGGLRGDTPALSIITSGLFFVYAIRGVMPPAVFPHSLPFRELVRDICRMSEAWEEEEKDYMSDIKALKAYLLMGHDMYLEDLKAYQLMGHDAISEATNLRFWMPEGDFDEKHFKGWPPSEWGYMQQMAAMGGFMPVWKKMATGWANNGI